MKLKVFRSTWGLVDASDGQKANVSKMLISYFYILKGLALKVVNTNSQLMNPEGSEIIGSNVVIK